MCKSKNSGNALLYVFMAVGLLAALTYSFTKGTKENYSTQNAAKAAEELYVQANLIKSSIVQCTNEYVEGGGDLNSDGIFNEDDNANTPFPLEPNNGLIENAPAGCVVQGNTAGCVSVAENNNVRNLSCIGAPLGEAYMFSGTNNSGAFLPQPPSGFEEWTYKNDSNGVYIQIIGKAKNATANMTVQRLKDKYSNCQSDIDYGNCGDNCFTAWIKRISCP